MGQIPHSAPKILEIVGSIFIGTQCGLLGNPVGTGRKNKSRGFPLDLFCALIPFIFQFRERSTFEAFYISVALQSRSISMTTHWAACVSIHLYSAYFRGQKHDKQDFITNEFQIRNQIEHLPMLFPLTHPYIMQKTNCY